MCLYNEQAKKTSSKVVNKVLQLIYIEDRPSRPKHYDISKDNYLHDFEQGYRLPYVKWGEKVTNKSCQK